MGTLTGKRLNHKKKKNNNDNAPIFKTILGKELHSLGKYFPVTIRKRDRTFSTIFFFLT